MDGDSSQETRIDEDQDLESSGKVIDVLISDIMGQRLNLHII